VQELGGELTILSSSTGTTLRTMVPVSTEMTGSPEAISAHVIPAAGVAGRGVGNGEFRLACHRSAGYKERRLETHRFAHGTTLALF